MRRGWLSLAALLLWEPVALADEESEVVEPDDVDEELPEAIEADAPAAPEPAAPTPLRATVVAPVEVEETLQPVGPPELPVRSKVMPKYPDELTVIYGQQAIRCEAQVWIDGKGRPLRVAMVDCPDGFHMAALEAMGKWRWEKPGGAVPDGGIVTVARTGFLRRDNRSFFPGVTYFRAPERVTSDAGLPVLLAGGKMPRYPRQVNAGDAVCLVELVVTGSGKTADPVIDDCARPYRVELSKVVKSWKWKWARKPARGQTQTVVAEVVFRL